MVLRILFAGLFVAGCWFAIFSWILLLAPIAVVASIGRMPLSSMIGGFLCAALALAGYFVWINWLVFAMRGRFLRVPGVVVQAVSFVQHVGWLLFFPIARGQSPWEVAEEMPLLVIWLIVNILVAVVTGLYFLATEEDGIDSWLEREPQ